MKNKEGNISYVLTLLFSIGMLFLTIITVINMLMPFVWYQKLENIASKYVYIVERFGYITELEKEIMLDELKNDGFDINKISFSCPEKRLAFGEPFEFSITYKLNMNNIVYNDKIKRETKEILLHVRKYGYSKI